MKKQTLMAIDRATDLGTIMKYMDQVMQEKDLTIKQIQLIPQENFIGAFVVFNEKEKPTEEPKERKTYLQDFLAKYPRASLENTTGEPRVCRGHVYGYNRDKCRRYNECADCWNEEMEG